MTKLKQLWNKCKLWVGLLVAGVVLSFLVLKKTVGDGLEQHRQQIKDEEEAKAAAQKKLEEEKKALEEKKGEEVKAVDDDKKKKLKDAVARAKEEKRKLVEQSKRDPQGFKIELKKELDVKEKKKKGRPKKDE